MREDQKPTPAQLVEELEYAILGAARTGDLKRVRAARTAVLEAMAAPSPTEARRIVDLVAAERTSARNQALEEAAAAITKHDRKGREWVPGSLWDTLSSEAAARVRALTNPITTGGTAP